MVTSAYISYCRAIRHTLGALVETFLCLITCCQFHFLFYSSRPLPNTFALALGEAMVLISSNHLFPFLSLSLSLSPSLPTSLVLLSLRYWLLRHYTPFIWLSGASIILFRYLPIVSVIIVSSSSLGLS